MQIKDMTYEQLLEYAKYIHVSMDSEELIQEFIKRLEELNDKHSTED